jgi:phage gp46-like protein
MIGLRDNLTKGDFAIINGKIATDFTLATPVYFSLFGGNFEADTPIQRRPNGAENKDWWGNLFEVRNPENRFNSKFERAAYTTPILSGTLRSFEQAAESDLSWMVEQNIAASVAAMVTIAAINELKIVIDIIKPDGTTENFSYLFNITKQEVSSDD